MTADRPPSEPDREPRTDDPTPLAAAFGAMYDELRRLAGVHLRGERHGHTLQPTALVHEAFVKIAASQLAHGPALDRNQLLALAARAMRRVLVDHARKRRARKRRDGQRRLTLHGDVLDSGGSEVDALVLHEALDELADLDARMAQVVELRFYGGLGIEEIATVLGVSDRTVDRDWRVARAWLLRHLSSGEAP